ncbi:MAG: hypothetical protein ACJ8D0_14520, partial [Xanthobacteraceae bacterium]
MPCVVPGITTSKAKPDKDVDGRDNPRRCGGSPGHDDVMGFEQLSGSHRQQTALGRDVAGEIGH